MTAPGTIMMAKMFEPETEVPETSGNVKLDIPKTDVNLVDAAARGTGEGLHLMLNVIAMLISFIALIALVNGGMGWVHTQGRVLSRQPADRSVLARPAGRLGAGRLVEGQWRRGRPARHARGAQRVHRLRAARAR